MTSRVEIFNWRLKLRSLLLLLTVTTISAASFHVEATPTKTSTPIEITSNITSAPQLAPSPSSNEENGYTDYSDNDEEATSFSADAAECKQAFDGSNICTYSEHASFSDKEVKLWAPTIEVHRDMTGQITKIAAIASKDTKAYYQNISETTDNAGKKIKSNQNTLASANIISIYPPQNLVTLDGDAQITQQGDTMQGEHLIYDIAKHAISTKTADIISAKNKQEIATIVLQPRNKK